MNRSASARIPDDWRNRLPDPASYYAQHVAKLGKPNAIGWAQGQCPFHEDRNASLAESPDAGVIQREAVERATILAMYHLGRLTMCRISRPVRAGNECLLHSGFRNFQSPEKERNP